MCLCYTLLVDDQIVGAIDARVLKCIVDNRKSRWGEGNRPLRTVSILHLPKTVGMNPLITVAVIYTDTCLFLPTLGGDQDDPIGTPSTVKG